MPSTETTGNENKLITPATDRKYVTAAEAVTAIQSGNNVFIHSAAAAPQQLIRAMVDRKGELRKVGIYQIHTEGIAPYVEPDATESFQAHAFFIGHNLRGAVREGRADYIPVFLSEIPSLFRKKIIPIDVAMIQVSLPDKHGFCSLGVSVDVTRAAIETAPVVIAQVNPNMPRTHGNSFIHIDKITHCVYADDPLPESFPGDPSEAEVNIGRHVASLVEDGATLQMGIGKIPNAVLSMLGNHKKLGIHTEMFSDGVIDLVHKGVITGELKKKHPGKIVSGFIIGSKRLYDFIDDNPEIVMQDIAYVNDPHIIKQNPRVTAINSAIEIDLTGQVCADSVGCQLYSGVGGQMDFMRGAALSDGGKPIIALNSITAKGKSKISLILKEGAGVVTTRAHVHYVVTEFGIADLYAKNIKERVKALINISHPMHRESLEKQAFEKYRIS